MPNATVRASARALPKAAPNAAAPSALAKATDALERLTGLVTDETADESRDPFTRAYVRWLRARVALDDPDDSYTEEEGYARLSEVNEAARTLLVTPVFRDDMLWQKWEVLEHFVSADAIEGHATDNRAVMALGCIKADLITLGIGRAKQ